MAIQKQERKITYKGQMPEEEAGEEQVASAGRVRRKIPSKASGRTDENGEEFREMEPEEWGQDEIGQRQDPMEQMNFGNERSFRNQSGGRNAGGEREMPETEEMYEKETIASHEKGVRERVVTSGSSRTFSAFETNSDERSVSSDDETGERIVRMDEVRRFRNQGASSEEKRITLQDSRLEKEGDIAREYDSVVRIIEWQTGNQRRQESEQKRMQEDAASVRVRYGVMEREAASDSYVMELNSESGMEMWDGDSDEATGSFGRVFHRGRGSFYHTGNYHTGNPMQVGEEPGGTQVETRYGARYFSQNSRRMKADTSADEGQSFRQSQRMGHEIHKTERRTRESAKKAQCTAKDAGKTAGKIVSETIDSINQYSELVSRPYETGKRTFSAVKETVSKEFQSVKEVASSAKDADETISARAKEMLKAMAVRTFREAVMLPIKLAQAAIKTVATVVATISTGGINLIIMLIALILSAAVLVCMIVFAGTMLIAYGVSEGLLFF